TTTTTTTTATTTTPPPATAPNIVIINVDDARVEALEVMPKSMSWFADGGTNFVNSYVSTPSCCPSRATLMTGQYVHNNGQVDQDTPSTDQDDSIQRLLSDAGYFTSHSGKYLHWLPLADTAPYWDRWTYFKGSYNNVWTNFDGNVQLSPTYSTIMTFESAMEHAESFDALNDDRPFYLHIAPVAPHKPYDPEPQYADAPVPTWNPNPSVGEADRSDKPIWVRYLNKTPAQGAADRESQLRLMMTVDDQVDRLMARLTELGEADNTIAIFTSDNGYFWSEHGRNSKFLPYNEAVEVPFLVRWPGQVGAGATSTDLVSHVDILPTVLAAADVTPGHVVDGRDILDPGFARSDLLTEYWEDEANANLIPDWSSIRNEARVYTEYYDDNNVVIAREYYDLTSDPWELVNLLGDGNPSNDPDTAAVAADLAAYRSCSGSSCR
ncbi:MAG: sulfatase-like hydrolase/transferase, partial [Acidimicrobiia bacterium]|nr:sulfatase-like hydrolase/transferase [Acidimicrobiia bacterium]